MSKELAWHLKACQPLRPSSVWAQRRVLLNGIGPKPYHAQSERLISEYTYDLTLNHNNNEPLSNFSKIILSSAIYGIFSGISNSLPSFQVAGVFYAGGELIKTKDTTLLGVFR